MAAATGTYSNRTHDGGGGDGGELEHTAQSTGAALMRQTKGNDGSWSRQQIKRAGYTKEEMRRRRDILEETRASLQIPHDNYCGFEAAVSTSSNPQAMEFIKAIVGLRRKTWTTGLVDWSKMRGLMVIDLIWLFGAVVARDEPKDAQERKECLNKALEEIARTSLAHRSRPVQVLPHSRLLLANMRYRVRADRLLSIIVLIRRSFTRHGLSDLP